MKQSRKNEEGVALMAVLGVLAMVMLLVATVVAVSQTQRYRTATLTQLGDSVYYEESAAHLTLWLLMNDKIRYADRSVTPGWDTPRKEERYLADGKEHLLTVNNLEYSVRLLDMYSGVDISSDNASKAFDFLNETLALNPERREELEIFKNRLLDYIDFDDNLHINGMEKVDYDEAGLSPLPRNAAPQYREEILWIPGSDKFVNPDESGLLNYVNIIPARGMLTAAPKSNLFGAPSELIREKCSLTDDELENAGKALARLRTEDITLDEAFSLRAPLLSKLKTAFSVVESGFYTICIRPSGDNQFGGHTLIFSLRVDDSPPTQGFQFFQWQFL